ncbi:MAG: hypothetical protein K8S25_07770 [Alphaproteobacteria bacterium]|nr:hypothetical protein [Alphaproteobacteria bacterium]
MSYAFHLLPPRADGDLREYARLEMDDGAFVPVDKAKEAMKMRIAEALVARYPDLEVSREGYGRDEPSRLRCFEINDLSDGSFGVQIQLFDDEAMVSVPFWHAGEKASACFVQVWDFMRIVCGVAGYAVFDKQMDRALVDGEGPDAALAAYAAAMKRVSRDPDLGGRKPPKPKWKK